MKKYRVNVNGTTYEVEIEEMAGGTTPPAPAPAPAPAASGAPQGGEKVTAPMPGTILAINVNQGDTVKRGQILMVLEAMKMENEILSPIDGRILSVNTSKGSAVESGALLCVIDRRA